MRKYLAALVVAMLAAGALITTAGAEEGVPCPDGGCPTVTVEASCGEAVITFTNPTAFFFSGDYRVGDEPGTADEVTGQTIAVGTYAGQAFGERYHVVDLDGRVQRSAVVETVTLTFDEDAHGGSVDVMARIWRGAENDWYVPAQTVSVATDCEPVETTLLAEQTACGAVTVTLINREAFVLVADFGHGTPTRGDIVNPDLIILEGPFAGQPFGYFYETPNGDLFAVPGGSTASRTLTLPEDAGGGSVDVVYRVKAGAEQNAHIAERTITVDTDCEAPPSTGTVSDDGDTEDADTCEAPGALTPEPAAPGITLAAWSCGTVGDLAGATSFWVIEDGRFVGYLVGAPDTVNADFLALFEDGVIPDGHLLIVVIVAVG